MPNPTFPLNLLAWCDQMEAYCKRATDGPWVLGSQDDSPEHEYEHCHLQGSEGEPIGVIEYGENGDADAQFLTHARTDLPLAVQAIRKLMEALHKVEWMRDREMDYTYCPSCGNSKESGHRQDCLTRRGLQEARDERGL